MLAIHERKIEALIKLFSSDIDSYEQKAVNKLENLLSLYYDVSYRQYLQYLISKRRKLITANLIELNALKVALDRILILDLDNAEDKVLRDDILTALGYKDMRSHFYPKYFQKLGLRACVYCNALLCVTVEDDTGNMVAKFQVDHHLPKDTNPGLSIALYNLYPTCSPCNNKKGTKEIEFKLYTDGVNTIKSQYKFKLIDKDKTVAEYLTNRDGSIIKIKLEEPPRSAGKHLLNQLFSIEGTYNLQTDIVEELIMKSHIYDDSMKEELLENFPMLLDEKTIERLIIGSYPDEVDMHKRPMTKFLQDISRQLGLLK